MKADGEDKPSKSIDEEADNKESEVSDCAATQEIGETIDGSNSNDKEGTCGKEEDEKKSSEVPSDENKECRKLTASDFKNDRNVVLREDLKTLFNKFGTVKVVDSFFSGHMDYIFFKLLLFERKSSA